MRRRLIAVYSCLALVLALFVAPFQHVHLGIDSDHEEHVHENVVHSHSLLLFLPTDAGTGVRLSDFDPPHRATSLDTFATAIPATAIPLFLPEARVSLAPPAARYSPIEVVDARSHDPPSLRFSSPRGPPV